MLQLRLCLPLLALTAIFPTSSATAQSTAASELSLGVQAYEESNFAEAERHFVKAVEQDAHNAVAHLYLATVYLQQYVPGAEETDNKSYAERAIEQYRAAIDLDLSASDRRNAVKGIAYLYLGMKNFDESRAFYLRASELDPNDPETYYSIGVIDWSLTYPPRMEERTKLKLAPGDSLPAKNKKVCAATREKNWANIGDGIDNLNKAIQLRPDYDDAMAYMNLMYRERADVQCEDPAAREQDLKMADEWVDKTIATKKLKAEKAEDRTTSPPKQRQQ